MVRFAYRFSRDRQRLVLQRYEALYCNIPATKRYKTLALSNSRQVPSSLYCKDILARYEDREVVRAGTST